MAGEKGFALGRRMGKRWSLTLAAVVALVAVVFAASASGTDARSDATTSAFKGQDGRIVYQVFTQQPFVPPPGGPNWDVYSAHPDDSKVSRLTTHRQDDVQPSVSPEGRRIAFVRDYAEKDSEIMIMNADGTNEGTLLHNKAEDRHPVFSPDGNWIAFVSRNSASSEPQISIVSAYGDGYPLRRLTAFPGKKRFLSFSPDGSQILFAGVDYSRSPSGDDAIFTISAGHGDQGFGTVVAIAGQNDDIGGFSLSAKGSRRVIAYRHKPPESRPLDWDAWHIYSGQGGGACGACTRHAWGAFPGGQLTFGGSDDVDPAISPEGGRVAFIRGSDLYVLRYFDDSDRSNKPRRVISLGNKASNLDWGPAP